MGRSGTARPLVVIAWAASIAGLFQGRAEAETFTPYTRGRVETTGAHVLIHYDGRVETLVEELSVMSSAASSVWLRAFPSPPKDMLPGDPSLFSNLDALTGVAEPNNEIMRPRLFGPSVVTLLTRKLVQTNGREKNRDPGFLETNRSLEIARLQFFTGKVETSTITHRPVFTPELVQFLAGEGVTLDRITEGQIAVYLNKGWTVMAAAIRDHHPSDQVPAKLGPFTAQFAAPTAVYPLDFDQSTSAQSKLFRFYLLGKKAMAPVGFETVWDDRPWEHENIPSRFRATRSQDVGTGPLEFELTERANLKVEPEWHLVRSDLRAQPNDRRDIGFSETKRAVSLPPGGKKGSGIDLFLCILLGLTPLLYTPESWFLLWLGTRARARARATRQEAPPFGVKLWSLYAVIVGAYWFLTLDGGGRVAAIVPALIGMIQLAMPYVERDPLPIRAQLRKKKK